MRWVLRGVVGLVVGCAKAPAPDSFLVEDDHAALLLPVGAAAVVELASPPSVAPEGVRTVADVDRVVVGYVPFVQYCYASVLAEVGPTGTVVQRLTIASDGSVVASAVSGALDMPSFGPCLVRNASKLDFGPASASVDVDVAWSVSMPRRP